MHCYYCEKRGMPCMTGTSRKQMFTCVNTMKWLFGQLLLFDTLDTHYGNQLRELSPGRSHMNQRLWMAYLGLLLRHLVFPFYSHAATLKTRDRSQTLTESGVLPASRLRQPDSASLVVIHGIMLR